MESSAKLREKFIESYSCTRCKALLEKLGPQDNAIECKKMVSKLAGEFTDIIRITME